MSANLLQNVNFTANAKSSLKPKAGSQRNSIMESVLMVAIIGLFWWFVVLPKKAEIATSQASLATLRGQESQMATTLKTLRQLVPQLNANQQQVQQLDEALPLDGNVIRLQLLVQSLAQSVGVSIDSITLSGQTDDVVSGDKSLLDNPYGAQRTLHTLSGSVSVVGSFDQLEAFLEKIENSGRIIDIDSLNITSSTKGELSLQIGVNSYYLAP